MQLKHIVLDFCGVFLDCSSYNFKPVPEMVEFAKSLREKSYKIYGFSNMSIAGLEKLNTLYPQEMGIFENVIVSEMIQYPKPHPDSFKEFLLLNNLKNNEIIFIDDSVDNINIASSVGIKAIHYTNLNNLILSLSAENVVL